MNIKTSLFILFLFSFGISQAQLHRCGALLAEEQLEQRFPGFEKAAEKTFQSAKEAINKGILQNRSSQKVQVVFHVVYNQPEENVPDQLIYDQLEQLNADFNWSSANDPITRNLYRPLAANADIEFVLASTDPNGNPTTGINRVNTDRTGFINFNFQTILQAILECGIDITADTLTQEQIDCLTDALGGTGLDSGLDDIKKFDTGGVDAWDPDRYINIWVGNYAVELVPGQGGEPFLLGFAYPPAEAPNWPAGTLPSNLEEVEGIVLHYQALGPGNATTGSLVGIADQGKTLSHEMGHYFGLRHVWGDGDCTEDDGIDDTPDMAGNTQDNLAANFDALNYTCIEFDPINTCTNDQLPDMYENMMNYTPEQCQSMFTKEQVSLMTTMLQGPRSGLLDALLGTPKIVNEDLEFFPNPVDDILNIRFSGVTNFEQVSIFDLNGKMVLQGKEVELNVGQLLAGMYLIRLDTGDKIYQSRFVKN
jgi:hypothetical protein